MGLNIGLVINYAFILRGSEEEQEILVIVYLLYLVKPSPLFIEISCQATEIPKVFLFMKKSKWKSKAFFFPEKHV